MKLPELSRMLENLKARHDKADKKGEDEDDNTNSTKDYTTS